MKLCGILLLFMTLWCGVLARCRMRGHCAFVGGFDKPCPVDMPAPPLIEGLSEEDARQALDILNLRCPTLALDSEGNRLEDGEIRTCCTLEQLIPMSNSLALAEGILNRCPACYRNFARQICEMNCSPDQSRFVEVETETTTNNVEYVNVINYRLHHDFMITAHASCAGVIMPQTGMPAINMMCGSAVVCDADAWFGFTGDTENNPLAPVHVNFLRWPTAEDSMSQRALFCNEQFGTDVNCSCVDCFVSCPTDREPVIPEVPIIGNTNIHIVGFIVAITFFGLTSIIFMTICIWEYWYTSRNNSSKPPNDKSNQNTIVIFFQNVFSKIGGISASNPLLMIMLTTWLVFAMAGGILNLQLTANPLELWSAPDSRSRAELNYFNARFGPFYRAAQVFLTFDLDSFEFENVTYGPAFRFEAIEELIKLEDAIINIGRDNGGVTLEQVCYAPTRSRGAEQRLDECVSMSVSVYLGAQRDNLDNSTYLNTIQSCLNNHYGLNCLASWGGGSEPEITFGGYDDNILKATTLLINFPIQNFNLEHDLEPVLEWEQNFIDLLHEYSNNLKPDYVTVSFGTERSIEDEIRRVSVAEAVPIAISYVLMFVYVTVALGNIKSWRTCFLDSKILVAMGSILVVIAAIACAIGTLGYAGVTITLLAINVIPFFVLSIGIDNVFLMVNTLDDIQSELKSYSEYNENLCFDDKRRLVFEKMFRKIGPSIFVSSVTQITCFAIGSLANFPAVVTFAIFASISLGYLFVFQITTVVAILSIDYKRVAQHRYDVFFCVQKKILDDENPLLSEKPHKSVTKRLMEPYSKVLLDWRVKIIVALLFMVMVSFSIALTPQIEIGLDQELALPKDSYVYSYLQAVNDLMKIGPPVYFVLKGGLNFTDPLHQNVICGAQMCFDDSLFTQVFLAARHSDITYIARSSNSWIDDFIDWTALRGSCCKYNITDGGFCQSTDTSSECVSCEIERYAGFYNGLRPSKEAFERYIPFFLRDRPSDLCSRAGLASYGSAVNYVLDSEGRATVFDTNFMAYHSTLGTSKDYINAVKYGYEVSANISAAIFEHTNAHVEVFPYSVFYVFYEQYLSMWGDTFASIGYCLIGAVVFKLLASGFNLLTTFAVIFTTILVVVNMMGVMYIWSIPLNAVSLVNLIVSIGIAVEFCTHVAYAFATSTRPPGEKVEDAIQAVGSTIITGITFTNIPIIVLAFSYTEIIEIFFFRMFFSLVILGVLHGMVFFPVLLSYLEFLFMRRK